MKDNTPKLVIRKENKSAITFKTLRVYSETNELIDGLVEETGMPKAKLIHMMVEFAIEHMEIVGGEEDES